MNLDLSKASCLDCIPVMVLKNCEPELSHILAEVSEGVLFSRLLKGFIGGPCMLGKGLQLKTTSLLVFFLWLVKSEKLVNHRIVDHLEKFGFFFSDFQYGFRSSRSTADLLTVVSDRIGRAFNRSGGYSGCST